MPRTILIVDDDPDIILFLSTALRDEGYQTVETSNGLEALEQMRARAPDLVLLDLMLPKKSGIALLGDMAQDERLRNIPVILVTGVSGETGIRLDTLMEKGGIGHASGSSISPQGYVEKPIHLPALLEMVRRCLSRPPDDEPCA